jgi:tetratricopeptide (TPR) repeat protein
MALFIASAFALFGKSHALLIGAGSYLVTSQVLRRGLSAAHREGIAELRRGNLESSIEAFKRSYDFFSHHSWLDRFRYLTLLSSSAYSYREMSLCNVAFLNGQLGRRDEAIAWYRRALQEFPTCSLARASLNLMTQPETP